MVNHLFVRSGVIAVGILTAAFPLVCTPGFAALRDSVSENEESGIDGELDEQLTSIRQAGGIDLIIGTAQYKPAPTLTPQSLRASQSGDACTLQVVSYTIGGLIHNSSKAACGVIPTSLSLTPTVKRFDHVTTTWNELGRVTATASASQILVASATGANAHIHPCTFAAATYGSVQFGSERYDAFAFAVGSFDIEP